MTELLKRQNHPCYSSHFEVSHIHEGCVLIIIFPEVKLQNAESKTELFKSGLQHVIFLLATNLEYFSNIVQNVQRISYLLY